MCKVGDIIKSQSFEGEEAEYLVVTSIIHNGRYPIPKFQSLDDYIMRKCTVLYNNERCTLRDVLESEKLKVIEEYENNVQIN